MVQGSVSSGGEPDVNSRADAALAMISLRYPQQMPPAGCSRRGPDRPRVRRAQAPEKPLRFPGVNRDAGGSVPMAGWPYSERSATIGSTPDARHAGIQQATAATADTKAPLPNR